MTRKIPQQKQTENSIVTLIQSVGKNLKIAYFILIVIVVLFLYKFFTSKTETSSIEYNTNLIEKQIKNVGKLIVTEGHFAEVLTYKDQQKYLMNLVSFEKKAIIIINAEVTVAYDLRQVKYDIDEKNKTITILNIPKEEIKISPTIKFYDIEQSTLNPFTGDDYNKIDKTVRTNLAKKMQKSALKSNAKNRFVSELSKILILTNTMGWKLEYEGKVIEKENDFNQKLKL